MQTKTFFIAMGLGAAAGTVMGMMMPKNKAMQQKGKEAAHTAAEKVTQAVDAVERKMS